MTKTGEIVTVIAFIIDYLLRWSTANLQLKKGLLSYILPVFVTFKDLKIYLLIING